MAREHTIRSGSPGAPTDYKQVYSEVTFASGDATVTASSLGLRFIKAFAGGAWGAAATTHTAGIFSSTTFSSNGVTSIDLHAREADPSETDATDLDTAHGVIFWGIT